MLARAATATAAGISVGLLFLILLGVNVSYTLGCWLWPIAPARLAEAPGPTDVYLIEANDQATVVRVVGKDVENLARYPLS
jgi:hypothetical protein